MSTIEADYNDSQFPLELVVNKPGIGGISGLFPTVAVRLLPTTDQYLDWTDLTFKTFGWGLKDAPMVDLGGGFYQRILNVAALGFTPLTGLPQKLSAQYTTTGAGTAGTDYDLVIVSELRPDAETSRQYVTNRLEELGGNPGHLTLYEDDGVTPLGTQTLRDYTGGAVVDTPGTPARRGPLT